MSETLLTAEELPVGFEYPSDFIRFVAMEIIYLEPWFVLTGERLRTRYQGLKGRYPDRRVVPLARREDNDDVACWDLSTGKISIVHDFADPGWDSRGDRGITPTGGLHSFAILRNSNVTGGAGTTTKASTPWSEISDYPRNTMAMSVSPSR